MWPKYASALLSKRRCTCYYCYFFMPYWDHEVYLSGNWFMQRTLEVDAAPREKMWQIEVKMNAQQQKTDRIGICYVDCLLIITSTSHMYFVLQKSSITENV